MKLITLKYKIQGEKIELFVDSNLQYHQAVMSPCFVSNYIEEKSELSKLKVELFEVYRFINKSHVNSKPIGMSAYMINRMNKLKEYLAL